MKNQIREKEPCKGKMVLKICKMNLRFFLIPLLIFVIIRPAGLPAADLIEVRAGNHEQFKRIVFEFPDKVDFDKPEIKGKGIFSIIFLNSSTTFPAFKKFQQSPSNKGMAIKLVQQGRDLKATIHLPFPYFTLKSFPLVNPDRIVIDAQIKLSPKVKSNPKKSLGDNLVIKNLTQNEKKIVEKSPSLPTEKVSVEVSNQRSEPPLPKIIISGNKPDRPEEGRAGISIKQLSLITGLIALLVFVVTIIFIQLRRSHLRDSKRLFELVGIIKKSNQRIQELDQQLIIEFRKFENF